MNVDIASLKYDAQGLIPAVLQDAQTHEVVMLGYMSAETLQQTLAIGEAVFWSRSRQEVWHKGATSGDTVRVLDVRTDCDADVLLIQVELLGGGICHTGAHSCFVEADEVTPRMVVVAAR
ncbi:MAG: phosphoribosyl-AMP cyclohydrolase [Dehalococcoidia bacterium]|nr:phosphoribosyl-AMP cyclohydrolase [Dehalococcoidia bacterium]